MKPHGYYPLHSNPAISFHETLPPKPALCADNFGIKYTNPTHAHHLVDTIKILHNINWLERKITVALFLIGITTKNMSMSLCLAIFKGPFTSFNIQHLRDLNMAHMNGLPHIMDQ